MSDIKKIEIVSEDIKDGDIIAIANVGTIKILEQVPITDMVGKYNWNIVKKRVCTYYIEILDRLVSLTWHKDETYIHTDVYDTKTGIWICRASILKDDFQDYDQMVQLFCSRLTSLGTPKKEYSNFLNKTKQMVIDSDVVTVGGGEENIVNSIKNSIHNLNNLRVIKIGKQSSLFD